MCYQLKIRETAPEGSFDKGWVNHKQVLIVFMRELPVTVIMGIIALQIIAPSRHFRNELIKLYMDLPCSGNQTNCG